jgi:hypothetical protein
MTSSTTRISSKRSCTILGCSARLTPPVDFFLSTLSGSHCAIFSGVHHQHPACRYIFHRIHFSIRVAPSLYPIPSTTVGIFYQRRREASGPRILGLQLLMGTNRFIQIHNLDFRAMIIKFSYPAVYILHNYTILLNRYRMYIFYLALL